MKALATVAIAAVTLVGCQAKQTSSAVTESLHPDTYSGVELAGPDSHAAYKYSVYSESAEALTVSIDKKTYNACFATQGYRVTQLAERRFLVEVEALAVPAVVCEPEHHREIENGIDLEIPANEYGYNYAEVIYLNTAYREPAMKLESSAGETYEDGKVALDIYSWFGRSNDSFTLAIDRKTVESCGAPVFHDATPMDNGFFVDINLAMRPAIPCRPDMVTKHELGLELKIEAQQEGYQWGRLITTRNPLDEANPVKVEIKAEHESGDLKNVDKVLECDLWSGDSKAMQLRIGLGYSNGREDLVLQSRRTESSAWNTDFTAAQTTAVYEGEGVTAMLGEGLADQNYKRDLDWSEDKRIKGRCFAFLPQYDFELRQDAEIADLYTGELKFSATHAKNPQMNDCPEPAIAPARIQTMYMKCAAVK